MLKKKTPDAHSQRDRGSDNLTLGGKFSKQDKLAKMHSIECKVASPLQ